jgi:galactarate dehydratase
MHERDNVAIVVNDGGLPAGTQIPNGPTLRDNAEHPRASPHAR